MTSLHVPGRCRRTPIPARRGRRCRQEHSRRSAHGNLPGQSKDTFRDSLLAGRNCGGMNRYACTNSQGGLRFTTAFLAEYDPESRTLTYINAGHNPPVLWHSSGAIERLTEGGVPLGIHEGTYESGRTTLRPGDWLVVFTDGLVEAVNQGDEEYGEPRLLKVLQAGAAGSPAELLQRIMADLDLFVGATPQHDDVTCMLLKAS